MDQSNKLKIDFLISNDTSLSHSTQNTFEPKIKKIKTLKKCNECNKKRKFLIHQLCNICYKIKIVTISGNKVIDDFIKSTLGNCSDYDSKKMKLEFVPYDRFKNIEFVAEGGFSKIYKATWIDGSIISNRWNEKKQKFVRKGRMEVALKELNNSKNIDSKELNELKIFYNSILKERSEIHRNINQYFGITQNPITQNFMIITNYYKSGDLTNYITNDFFNISWRIKLRKLRDMIEGLKKLHDADVIHKDYHSGNIFNIDSENSYISAITGDFGISKSATESSDDDNEVYGIIPYVAPEVFQGQKYTKESDIYSFGMIMWELMTGRRPFWDKSHDTELIIEICDGLRPPIVTNAPDGYIELMQKCWHSDPNERPSTGDIFGKFRYSYNQLGYWKEHDNPTKIIKSRDIGPIANNPDAVYKSRSLSTMIKSAKLTKSLNNSEFGNLHHFFSKGKRKCNNNLIEDNNEDKTVKKLKFCEDKDDDYLTKEIAFDIDHTNSNKFNNNYTTKELDFDI